MKAATMIQMKVQSNTRLSAVAAVLDSTRARVLLIAAAVVLGMAYVWLVNSSAAAGFYLSDLEDRVAVLENEYRALEIEKTALTSLEEIEKQSTELGLVASTTVEYATGDSAVAVINR